MRLDQAITLNERFTKMKQEIDDMHHISDSIATHSLRQNAIQDAHILKLQQDLAYARIDGRRGQDFQARIFFGFWTAFVTYMQITR